MDQSISTTNARKIQKTEHEGLHRYTSKKQRFISDVKEQSKVCFNCMSHIVLSLPQLFPQKHVLLFHCFLFVVVFGFFVFCFSFCGIFPCVLWKFRWVLCLFAAFFNLLVFSSITVRLTSQGHHTFLTDKSAKRLLIKGKTLYHKYITNINI